MKCKIFVFVVLFVAASTHCQAQGSVDLNDLAVEIVKQGVATDWDFEQSYVGQVCPSIKDVMLANPMSAEEWAKTGRYGALVDVIGVEQAPGYSDTLQIDVKAAMENAQRPVVFRFWLKTEAGAPCIYGYNFFEEFGE